MASATSSLPWLRLPANTSAWLSRRDRVFGLPKTHAVSTVTRQSNQQSNSPCYSHSRHDQIQHPHEERPGRRPKSDILGRIRSCLCRWPWLSKFPNLRARAIGLRLGSGLGLHRSVQGFASGLHMTRELRVARGPLGPVTSQQLARDA